MSMVDATRRDRNRRKLIYKRTVMKMLGAKNVDKSSLR